LEGKDTPNRQKGKGGTKHYVLLKKGGENKIVSRDEHKKGQREGGRMEGRAPQMDFGVKGGEKKGRGKGKLSCKGVLNA